jgi:hypothetical protein
LRWYIKISSERSFEEVRQSSKAPCQKFDRNIDAALRSGDKKSAKDYEESGPVLSILAAIDHGANFQMRPQTQRIAL